MSWLVQWITRTKKEESKMGETMDKVKGKAKQVEGILTNDKALKHEGERDEAKGKLKGIVNKAGDAVHDAVDAVKHAIKKH